MDLCNVSAERNFLQLIYLYRRKEPTIYIYKIPFKKSCYMERIDKMNETKKKSPGLAAFLNFLIWGVGYIYVEKVGMGVIFILLECVTTFIMIYMYAEDVICGLSIISVIVTILIMIHAFNLAKKYNGAIDSSRRRPIHPITSRPTENYLTLKKTETIYVSQSENKDSSMQEMVPQFEDEMPELVPEEPLWEPMEEVEESPEYKQITMCPYCGKDLFFPEPVKFCPFCKKRIS